MIRIDNVAILAGAYWTPTHWLPAKGEAFIRVTYHTAYGGAFVPSGSVLVTQKGRPRSLFAGPMQPGITLDGTPAFYVRESDYFKGSPDIPLNLIFTLTLGKERDRLNQVITVPPPLYVSTPLPRTKSRPFISIDRVGILHRVNGVLQLTTSLQAGETGVFFAMYRLSSPGPYVSSGYLSSTGVSRPFEMTPGITDSGSHYFTSGQQFSVKGPSRMIASFTLTLGNASSKRSLTFVVKPGG